MEIEMCRQCGGLGYIPIPIDILGKNHNHAAIEEHLSMYAESKWSKIYSGVGYQIFSCNLCDAGNLARNPKGGN